MIKRFFLIILLFSIFSINVVAQADGEINTEKLEAMIAPSYARIYTKSCVKFTSGASYEQCLITIGDGVYISADGYILTNSQIGKHTADDVADRMLSTQDGVLFYVTNIYPKTDGAQVLNEIAALALIDQILSGDEFRAQAVENVMSTVNSNEVAVDILSEVSYVEKDGVEFTFDDSLELTNSSDNLEVKEVISLAAIQTKKEDNSPVLLKVETEDHPTIQIDNVEFNIESNYFKQGETARSGSGLVTDVAARELVLLNGPTIIDTIQDFTGKLINQSESDKETDKLFLLAEDGKVSAVHGSFKVYDDFDEYYFNNEYLNNLLTVEEIELAASETDDLWRNAVNAYFEDDFDGAIQLFNQILNIYPEHQSANFYKQRAELQVVKPTTDQTDNQILLFLRQYISSDITEEQIPMILGSIVGGFVAIIFALFFIRKLFNKKDKLPKMPDPQSQIKDENDLIQNELPEPVMQQAVMPMTSGGALPVLEETKSQPHEPVENMNMNDKNMPVQAVEQTLSGNPSAPIVPMMGTQVMPHPEEQTPDLVEEVRVQNMQNDPVNDAAPIYEQSATVPDGMPDLNTQPVVEPITLNQVPDAIPTITPEESVIPTATQTNNSGYRIIDDEPDEIESLVEDMAEESGIGSQKSEEAQQPIVDSLQPTVEQLGEEPVAQNPIPIQEPEPSIPAVTLEPVAPVTPPIEEVTADQMPGLLKTIEEVEVQPEVGSRKSEEVQAIQPVQAPMTEEKPVVEQPVQEQPTVASQQSTVTIEPEKVEKTLPPIPVQPSATSNQPVEGSLQTEIPSPITTQPATSEELTEEEQRRRDKKRERRRKWREKRKTRRKSEVGSQKSEEGQQSASQQSGGLQEQSTVNSPQSTDLQSGPQPTVDPEPVEETEPELPDWLKPVE